MRIGALAARTGVPERLLRYYEEQGLLLPARTSGGFREYVERDVVVVGRIRALLASGLNTASIAELLPCICEESGHLVPMCPEMLIHLSRERDRLSSTIEQLGAARQRLDEVIDAAPAEIREAAFVLPAPDTLAG